MPEDAASRPETAIVGTAAISVPMKRRREQGVIETAIIRRGSAGCQRSIICRVVGAGLSWRQTIGRKSHLRRLPLRATERDQARGYLEGRWTVLRVVSFAIRRGTDVGWAVVASEIATILTPDTSLR